MADLDFGETIKGFSPGQKAFSRYTLTRILGRGGMGVVWLARDEELEREVALKFLPEVVAADKEAVKELKRETRRSLELTHSHIVRIYDFVQDARTAAISMEYIAGDTLSSRKSDLDRGHFEPAELSAWVAQLCSALDYAHDVAQIVHRDLKPANLMVDARGHLKVADFGIATSISDSVSRVSKQAGSSGTPVYMSPQQMMGERPAVTDDIYALGATLYDLLSGKPPFYSGNIIVQVQGKIAPSITERRKELGLAGEPVPSDWEQTIAACLAKEPKDRPQSAGEVTERLGLVAKGNTQRPTSNAERSTKATRTESKVEPGLPPSPGYGGTSRTGSERGPAGAGPRPTSKAPLFAGLAAAVLALGGLGWYFGIHAPEQKRLAEQARIEAEHAATEQQRIKLEQEKAAAAEREKQEKASAEAKAKAEEEQKAYAVIVAKIDAFVDGSPTTLRVSTDTAVKAYLAGAPARFRVEIETRWTDRQAAWETALQKEQAHLAAERLANSRGGIAIRTNPAGAEVRVGAIALDKSPLTLKDQKLGKYPVRIRLEGYEEWTGEVEVKENEFADLDLSLVRSTGRVVLTGTSGATVTANGRTLGTLPLTLDRVPTGPVRYSVALKGHKPAELSGTVQRNTDLRLSANLEEQNFPQPGKPWENTLGQKFVPVPGTNVLFCIWETRVQDFEAFVRETNYVATAGAYTLNSAGKLGQYGGSWRNPGYSQTGLHPVGCMSRADAEAFCRWLTDKERRAGKLGPDQVYRLPTDAEWDAAVGGDQFPWGNQWPPPQGAGNYADAAAKRQWSSRGLIVRYDDGYAGTAPVGSFKPNRYGIYDLGGNLWELVADRKHEVRGASFTNHPHLHDHDLLASSFHFADVLRFDFGFRVVVAVGSEGSASSGSSLTVPSNTSPSSTKPVVGQKWTIPDLALDMMPIAPGTFQMGSASGGDKFERPVTRVILTKHFWLGKTEVTQAQWMAVMSGNPSEYKGDNLPVERVSWDDAMEYCRKLTEREQTAGRLPDGYAYTLPTEWQWEYACRAGTTGDFAGDLDAMAWYTRNTDIGTRPVATKQANAWGLHDMHGNVWEWCANGHFLYPGGSVTDPIDFPVDMWNITRGGGWTGAAIDCRSAKRYLIGKDARLALIGFRIALASLK